MCPYFSRRSTVMILCVRAYSTAGIVVWGWRHRFYVRRGLYESMPFLGKIRFGHRPYPLYILHCSVICCVQHLGSCSFVSESFHTYVIPPNYLFLCPSTLLIVLHVYAPVPLLVLWFEGCGTFSMVGGFCIFIILMTFVWFWTVHDLIMIQLHIICIDFTLFRNFAYHLHWFYIVL